MPIVMKVMYLPRASPCLVTGAMSEAVDMASWL